MYTKVNEKIRKFEFKVGVGAAMNSNKVEGLDSDTVFLVNVVKL